MLRLRLFTALLMALMLWTCSYDIKELTPTYAIPLVKSRLGVYNLMAKLDSSIVQQDSRGVVNLVYQQELLALDAFSFVGIPDQSPTASAVYSGPTLNPFPLLQVVNYNGSMEIDVAGFPMAELYQSFLDVGNLVVQMNSSIRHDLSYTLTFPGILKNGSPLTYTQSSNYSGSNHFQEMPLSLSGDSLDFTASGTTHSKLRVNYNVSVRSVGGVVFNTGEKLDFTFKFSNLKPLRLYGYLGQFNLPAFKDSVPLRLFQFTNEAASAVEGNFSLTDPQLNLKIRNSIVLPFEFTIDQLRFKQINTGTYSDLTLSGVNNPFSVDYPLSPGNERITSLLINRNNSNIKELLTPVDKLLIYQMTAAVNKGGKSVNQFSKGSKLAIDAEVKLPLTGYAGNWILGDTTELSLTLGDNQELKSGLVRLNLSSNFPLDVKLQLYFLDVNKQITDSLFIDDFYLLSSGQIGPDGKILNPVKTKKDIGADQKKMQAISNAKYAWIKAELQTTDFQSKREVSIFSDCFIDIELGVKAEIGFQF